MGDRRYYERWLADVARDDLERDRPRMIRELEAFAAPTWPHVLVLEHADLDEVLAWMQESNQGPEWSSRNPGGRWKIWFRSPVVVWCRDTELHIEMVLRWC